MTSNQQQSEGGGCFGVFVALVVLALILAAIVSVAALIDPFSWLPPVGEIWKDCHGDCDLAHRFPGFWSHVVANLAYVVASLGFLGWLMAAVGDLRKARGARFEGWEQARRYGAARQAAAVPATACLVLAALPFLVALD